LSRYYNMHVRVDGYQPACVHAIKQAAEHEWTFGSWHERDGQLSALGESSLCAGETEEEFAQRLAVAIWRANGG